MPTAKRVFAKSVPGGRHGWLGTWALFAVVLAPSSSHLASCRGASLGPRRFLPRMTWLLMSLRTSASGFSNDVLTMKVFGARPAGGGSA